MLCGDEICLVNEFIGHPKDMVKLLSVNKEWNQLKENENFLKNLILRTVEVKNLKNWKSLKIVSKKNTNMTWKQKFYLLAEKIKEENFLKFTNKMLWEDDFNFEEKWKIIIKNMKLFKNFQFLRNIHLGNRESLLDLFFKSMIFVKVDDQVAFDLFEEIYTTTSLKLYKKHGQDYPFFHLLRTKKTNLISKIKKRCVKEHDPSDVDYKYEIKFKEIPYHKTTQNLIISILHRFQYYKLKETFIHQYESIELNEDSLNVFFMTNYDLKIWELLKINLIQIVGVKSLSDYAFQSLKKNENFLEKFEILLDAMKWKNIESVFITRLFRSFPQKELEITKLLCSKTNFLERENSKRIIATLPIDCVDYLIQLGFCPKFDDLLSVMKTFKVPNLNEKVKLYLKHDVNSKIIKSTKFIAHLKCQYYSLKELQDLSIFVKQELNL
jgi:hypothetical protein